MQFGGGKKKHPCISLGLGLTSKLKIQITQLIKYRWYTIIIHWPEISYKFIGMH